MNLGNRNSQHSFAQIPSVNMARSKFNRSYQIKDTLYFDQLTPIHIDEVLPGDTINMSVKTFARLATQVVPLMDNMYLDFFFFYVPNRLVWENWERFNGAQDNPTDSTDFLIPQVVSPTGGWQVGSIYDKMGLPTEVENLSVTALPFRAYNLIINEWFRDQNLQDSLTVLKTDGPDPQTNYTLFTPAKKHDYFTSALPWPQKGDPVQMPLGLSAPVYGQPLSAPVAPDILTSFNSHLYQATRTSTGLTTTGTQNVNASNQILFNDVTAARTGVSLATREQYDAYFSDRVEPPYADLSEATAATINQLRQAFMVQSMLELDARGGTRYTEILRAHFNVISPDFRLQRPEYLSGGTTSFNQHPVAQNSETGSTPQANLAAFSTASTGGDQIGFSKSFVEHGYVIGLVRARADITYQQGLNKLWTRNTKYDFFWPKLQELGEQAILNKEIYATGTSADEDIFGYQERFAEYRYKPSEVRGQFRSTFAQSLDVWHLAEEFGTAPALNSTFIQSNTPIERSLVVPDPDYPHILFDAFYQQTHARPMVTHGVPATLGRF